MKMESTRKKSSRFLGYVVSISAFKGKIEQRKRQSNEKRKGEGDREVRARTSHTGNTDPLSSLTQL